LPFEPHGVGKVGSPSGQMMNVARGEAQIKQLHRRATCREESCKKCRVRGNLPRGAQRQQTRQEKSASHDDENRQVNHGPDAGLGEGNACREAGSDKQKRMRG
jgi:hypothetical protein